MFREMVLTRVNLGVNVADYMGIPSWEARVSPKPPRMRAKKGFKHSRIWWLLNDNGNCRPAEVFRDARAEQKDTFDRMLAILDHTDRKGPPPLTSQYNPLGKGLVEFKVSKPTLLRLYATSINGGWLIVYAGTSKNTQSKDIAQARRRVTEVKTRGCDID